MYSVVRLYLHFNDYILESKETLVPHGLPLRISYYYTSYYIGDEENEKRMHWLCMAQLANSSKDT